MNTTINQIFSNLNSSQDKALWVNNVSYTYKQLGGLAKQVVSTLKDNQLHQDTVAIFSNRRFESYAGLLGVLGSGNIFLPINTKQPTSRIVDILQTSRCKAILVSDSDYQLVQELRPLIPSIKLFKLSDNAIPNLATIDAIPLSNGPTEYEFTPVPGEYAYMMFTSGTTGKPKGIAIKHDQLDQYVGHINEEYPFSKSDKFSQHADLTFDISIHDWAIAFSNGASLYVVPELLKSCPVDFICKHQLTCWLSVPSVINLSDVSGRLKPDVMPSIRLSLFMGQALPVNSAQRWHRAANNSRIVNLYGPTEGTIAICSHEWDPEYDYQTATVPIGKVFSTQNSDINIEENQTGELLLSGSQLIEKYWENEEADQSAFILANQKKWYKTGDIVHRQSNGDYYFIGRTDHQVKIQGYRIELGEIESIVRKTGIESVAVPWPVDSNNQPQGIVLVIKEQESISDVSDLLKKNLPKYMQPNGIYLIPSIPYNQNGKTDIKTLQQFLNQQAITC